jgi:acetyl esterase/lipase
MLVAMIPRVLAAFFALATPRSAMAQAQGNRAGGPRDRPSPPTVPAAPTLETGEINGARFTVARPPVWNRSVLLIAPGARAADRPLVADLSPAPLADRILLEEGWLVAKTTYRRPGVIIADAIGDLDALRAHIATKYGTPDRVLVAGESMGGLIATLIAERAPRLDESGRPDYAGAIAIGAALQLREPVSSIALSLEPKIPLLFLANQSEFDGPRNYVTTDVSRPDSLRPALLRVARNGHVNVNQRERLAALRALVAWLDHGRAALPRPGSGEPGQASASVQFADVSIVPAPQPSQVRPHADGLGFDARVTGVSPLYGALILDAQPGDFANAGIGLMHWFQLTAHGANFRVLNGRDSSSVKRGAWFAIPDAEGFFRLGRNYADAAAAANLTVGDTVSIRRFDDVK